MDAAIRASERSLRRSPYYAMRFGDRGRRFSHSDSLWLAALPDTSEAYLHRQIQWLAGVLANRGMPTLLLEAHLRLLCEALREAVPGRRADYALLAKAADNLRAARELRVSNDDVLRLAQGFARRCGLGDTHTTRATGRMFVAAVADEASGHIQAVTTIVEWFQGVAIFQQGSWMEAMHQTMADARTVATSTPVESVGPAASP